jgi:hypothetical protein
LINEKVKKEETKIKEKERKSSPSSSPVKKKLPWRCGSVKRLKKYDLI